MTVALVDRLRESAHDRWFTDSALLVEAADRIDELEATVERDHRLLLDHHIEVLS